jgi:hypothetical protein
MTGWQYTHKLIQSNQPSAPNATTTPVKDVIPLRSFVHNARELLVVARRQSSINAGDHFDMWGYNNTYADGPQGPLQRMGLFFDNVERVRMRHADAYWHALTHHSHSRVPRDPVYCLPFGFDLEENESSGSANLGKLKNVELHLEIDPRMFWNYETSAPDPIVIVNVMSPYYNVIRFVKGAAIVRFH